MRTIFVILLLFSFNIYAQVIEAFDACGYSSSNITNNEPSISINPTNLNNFVIGTNYREKQGTWINKIGYYYTTDGGRNWQGSYLNQNDYNKFADPTVVFNSTGTAFLAYLGTGDNPANNSGIFVSGSGNGGQTWGPRMTIAQAQYQTNRVEYDKPFLAVHKQIGSSYNDRVYLSFAKANIFFNGSTYVHKWNEIQSSYYDPETAVFSSPITVNDISSTSDDFQVIARFVRNI